MDNAEEIRTPDKSVIDRLFQHDYTYTPYNMKYKSEENYNEEIKRVLEESEEDFEFQYAILESKRMAKEREERAKHFSGFLTKIRQFSRIDKLNESFYSELICYIESYERGEIEFINVSKEFFMKFVQTLDNMRLNPEDKSRLLQFIQL